MTTIPTIDSIRDLEMVLVSAPLVRSGSTLIQRILCSADNALIYGEPCAGDIHHFLNLYSLRALTYQNGKESRQRDLDRVLAGDANEWVFDLMPPADGYTAALGEGAALFLQHCRDFAATSGRPIWGVKAVGWDMSTIRLLMQFLPRTRVVHVYRDIFDCIRSAKAIGIVTGLESVRDHCREWVRILGQFLEQRDDPAFLLLRLEHLVAEPDKGIDRLAAFTGATGIQREILDRKINTIAGEDARDPDRKGHIPPAELSEEESEIIDAETRSFSEKLS